MGSEYNSVLIQFFIVLLFAVVTLLASHLLGKRSKKNKTKDSAYECGMLPLTKKKSRFSVKFYLIAILFVLFDIEVVFMYPWAVVYKKLIYEGNTVILFSMLGFVSILFISYIYAFKKGAFDMSK